MKISLPYSWLVILLLSLGAGAARAADVTFSVNMQFQIRQGNFVAGTDQVMVFGSFSAAGVALSDPDGDQVYSATVPNQPEDAQLTYNYRFTHGGAAVNETVPARPYVVQVTSAANVLTDWFNDQPPPYPYAKLYASTLTPIPGEAVRFTDSSEGGAATSWRWTFAGGSPATSTAPNPIVVWTAPGSYAVTLTATNASGSTTSKTLTVRVGPPDSALGWWNDAIFYQIYPRSFLDSNGDGTGDFAGLLRKLDYLNDGNPATTTDLGVTALYLMPVHPATHSYLGGYEVIDYKGINYEYGTSIDFSQLVAAAHARGMKVILDMVFNHTSTQNPWFTTAAAGTGSPYDNYYVFRSDNPGGNWRPNPSSHTNPNFNYFFGKFGPDTPDLNYYNASVRNTVKDISSYWLGRNVDGFRLDAPMFLYETGNALTDAQQQNLPATYAYWRGWRDHIKAANPQAFSVGETWLQGDIPGAARYVYQGFDIGFQFDIAFGLEDALNKGNKLFLQNPVEQSLQYYPFLQFGVFASNHDLYLRSSGNTNPLRIKDRVSGDKDAQAKLAAAWLLTAPGVPFVYYGDEIGIGSTYARSPMQWDATANAGFTTGTPWAAIGADYATYNVASEQNDPASILSAYRGLIAVRAAQPALRRGSYQTLTTSVPGVYAFARTNGSETVVVVLNFAPLGQRNVTLTLPPSTLAAGTYAADNLLSPSAAAAAPLTVAADGSIAGWVPYPLLPANGYAVLKLRGSTALAAAGPAAISALAVYPNPIGQGRLTVRLPGPAASAQLRLLDSQGRLVLAREAAVANGQASLEISGLAPGIYLLQATSGGTTYVSKVSVF
ncbi:alpha-amylase family glycosyl hydrolase [Hymenobacter psoromatis]|uniref:alpha-amylase family glycosyl hydrolase n=1 Tax=Hymenobacter psoromatis TaxID=1484116 RepID=UPI001CBD5E1A|nr:alpha-amylase family glycosyl hydrolase [Hymenobacter psoromatis]